MGKEIPAFATTARLRVLGFWDVILYSGLFNITRHFDGT
jgi:hypothetical protein